MRRGLKQDLPELNIGEIGFCLDTKEVYIGSEAGNILINDYEETVTSGYYDEVANELVLVLANGSEIRIPVSDLLTDLDAHNIRFNGSGTNYLTDETDVESAVKELDTRVKANTDDKVDISDIVDDLVSTDVDKPLSANQGKVLNDTTAKLAVSNVFTQPQQVPNATLAQHAVNKLQVETMFEMFKQQLRGYNLAMPDLSSATDLGDGVYRVYNINGNTIDYNVNTGVYTLNKTTLNAIAYVLNQNLIFNQQYTIKIYIISTDYENFQVRYRGSEVYKYFLKLNNYQDTFVASINDLIIGQGSIEPSQTIVFKLQLEKGDTATPYTVPGQIPQYKIVGEE